MAFRRKIHRDDVTVMTILLCTGKSKTIIVACNMLDYFHPSYFIIIKV